MFTASLRHWHDKEEEEDVRDDSSLAQLFPECNQTPFARS